MANRPMRIFVLSSLVMTGVTFTASARADKQKTTSGVELGLRPGYAIPFGGAAGSAASSSANEKLSDVFSGQVPFWLDAGYRIPNLYVGAFFQFGYLIQANNTMTGCGQPTQPGQPGMSCRGSDLVFGANAHYHFAPGGPFDPWIGLGFGFEWANADQSLGYASETSQLSGWQFVSFQLGADRAGTNYGIGPFVAFSIGQYSSASASVGSASVSGDIKYQQLHEWLTFGLRFAFDINTVSTATTDVQSAAD